MREHDPDATFVHTIDLHEDGSSTYRVWGPVAELPDDFDPWTTSLPPLKEQNTPAEEAA